MPICAKDLLCRSLCTESPFCCFQINAIFLFIKYAMECFCKCACKIVQKNHWIILTEYIFKQVQITGLNFYMWTERENQIYPLHTSLCCYGCSATVLIQNSMFIVKGLKPLGKCCDVYILITFFHCGLGLCCVRCLQCNNISAPCCSIWLVPWDGDWQVILEKY